MTKLPAVLSQGIGQQESNDIKSPVVIDLPRDSGGIGKLLTRKIFLEEIYVRRKNL